MKSKNSEYVKMGQLADEMKLESEVEEKWLHKVQPD